MIASAVVVWVFALVIDCSFRSVLEPLAELMSMGMAALVLWWIEEAVVSRRAIHDALTTAWVKLLA